MVKSVPGTEMPQELSERLNRQLLLSLSVDMRLSMLQSFERAVRRMLLYNALSQIVHARVDKIRSEDSKSLGAFSTR